MRAAAVFAIAMGCAAVALTVGCANGGNFPEDDGGDGFPDSRDPRADARPDARDEPDAEPPADARPDARPCVEGHQNMVANGRCYMWFDQDREWDDAVSDCAGLGAHLVTVGDAAENTLVQALGASAGYVWLGASDLVLEGSWIWVDGVPSSYTNWSSGQPDNGSGTEDCVYMLADGRWNDDQCGHGVRYVCERD
jgi:hypothetical protein